MGITMMVSSCQSEKQELKESVKYVKIADKYIADVEESLEEIKASFEVGLNTSTDLLNSQTVWHKAKS